METPRRAAPRGAACPYRAPLTFTELELVEDGGFTGSIKTNHQDTHFLLAELWRGEG